MTAEDQYNPVPEPRQDTDASIIAMLDEMLAQDDFVVWKATDGWEVCEYSAATDTFYNKIDTYETRAAAYRGAIDCLIEACVFAWDKGDEE